MLDLKAKFDHLVTTRFVMPVFAFNVKIYLDNPDFWITESFETKLRRVEEALEFSAYDYTTDEKKLPPEVRCHGQKWVKAPTVFYICKAENHKDPLIFTNHPRVARVSSLEPYMCSKLNGTNYEPTIGLEVLRLYAQGLL